MNIKLIVIGETNSKDLKQLIDLYTAKLKFYINFELVVLKDERKKLQQNVQIKKEGEKILSILKKNDFIILEGDEYVINVPDTGENLFRRSLYTFWKRTVPPPSMMIFDAPTRVIKPTIISIQDDLFTRNG